jgi:ABC-type spermidine/putrescine transport system permease subunit II
VTGFTLKWFGSVIHDALYLRGASNSFVIACAAAAISVLLGTISALAIGRGYIRNPLLYLGLVGTPAIFPLLLTGMAVAGYFQFLGLQGTTLAVVIVHTAYASPFALSIVLNGYTRPVKLLEAVGRNLGASEAAIVGRVTIPQLAPSLFAAFSLCFLLSWNEFVLAWFVSGLMPTLPTVIYGKFGAVTDPSVSAVGVLVVAISLLVMVTGCFVYFRSKPGTVHPQKAVT